MHRHTGTHIEFYTVRYFHVESQKTSTQTFLTTTKRKDTMIKSMGNRRYSCIVHSCLCCC